MNFNAMKSFLAVAMTTDVEKILSGADSADTGAFDGIANSISTTGYGINRIVVIIAIMVFLISGGAAFIRGFVTGTPQQRADFKEAALFKVLCVVGFFALAGIIIMLSKFGLNLFTS